MAGSRIEIDVDVGDAALRAMQALEKRVAALEETNQARGLSVGSQIWFRETDASEWQEAILIGNDGAIGVRLADTPDHDGIPQPTYRVKHGYAHRHFEGIHWRWRT